LTRIRSSSSASLSTQVTLNAQLKQPQQRKTLVMPPSVMPALNTTTTSRGKNNNNNSNNMKLTHAFSTAPELSSLRKNFKTKSNNEDESLHLMANENIMSGGGGSGDLNSNHNSTKA